MEDMLYTKKMILLGNEEKLIKRLCKMTGEEIYQAHILEPGENIIYTIDFADGLQVNLELILRENERSFISGTLLLNGKELTMPENRDDLFGEWIFDIESIGKQYKVIILPETYFEECAIKRQSDVFEMVSAFCKSQPWIPVFTRLDSNDEVIEQYPDDLDIVQVTFIGYNDNLLHCEAFAYRRNGEWYWALNDEEVNVSITAWRSGSISIPYDDGKQFVIVTATEHDGLETTTYVYHFLVDKKYTDHEKLKAQIRKICMEWCKTDQGKKDWEHNCHAFNYGDFVQIPNSFMKRYGIEYIPTSTNVLNVLLDEQLVLEEDLQ